MNASSPTVEKEYGYQNGQLLVTINSASAPKLTPASVTASNSYSSSYTPDKAIDNNASTWWSSGGFASQWIQLDLGAGADLNKIRLLVNQDPSGSTIHEVHGGATPGSLSLLGTLTGSTSESQWLQLNSTATGVRYVKIITTSSPSWVGWREIEVYGTPVVSKLTPASATASASYSSSYTPDKAIDGSSATWWSSCNFPLQWIQLDLGSAADLNKIKLLVNQDPSGSTIHQISGGPDTNNLSSLGTLSGSTIDGQWLQLNSNAKNVRYITVETTSSASWVGWYEIEVYGVPAGSSASTEINWLVTDQLGTPRMVFDQSGSLATTKRHDYLPFGEELSSVVGLRSSSLGYTGDLIRQKFTSQERDIETGLDYFIARYHSSAQGRFTSADTVAGSSSNPQTLNLYTYVQNNPLRFIDPTGHFAVDGILLTNDPNTNNRMYELLGIESASDGSEDVAASLKRTPENSSESLQKRKESTADRIARIAAANEGGEEWRTSKFRRARRNKNVVFGEGKNKCNLFVYEVLLRAGISPPTSSGKGEWPARAEEWADTSIRNLSGWALVENGGMQAGDVVALARWSIFSTTEASGHVAIAVSSDRTVGTGRDDGRIERGKFGSRWHEFGVVVRRYVGKGN